MSLLNILLPTAYAAGAAPAHAHTQQGSMISTVVMLAVFFAIFYFLMIRPQNKRAKQQRELLSKLKVDDEVVTNSGLMGTIKAVDDTIVSLEVSESTIIKIQKQVISNVLPKGTL